MKCDARKLKDAVRRVSVCAGKGYRWRYDMEVVQFEPSLDAIVLVSTDAKQLAAVRVPADNVVQETFLIEACQLKKMAARWQDGQVEISVDPEEVAFSHSDGSVHREPRSQVKFPDWRKRLPCGNTVSHTICPVYGVREILNRFPKKQIKGVTLMVRLELLQGTLRLTAQYENAPDEARVEDLEVEYAGPHQSIWLNLELWKRFFQPSMSRKDSCEISVFQAKNVVRCSFPRFNASYWLAGLSS